MATGHPRAARMPIVVGVRPSPLDLVPGMTPFPHVPCVAFNMGLVETPSMATYRFAWWGTPLRGAERPTFRCFITVEDERGAARYIRVDEMLIACPSKTSMLLHAVRPQPSDGALQATVVNIPEQPRPAEWRAIGRGHVFVNDPPLGGRPAGTGTFRDAEDFRRAAVAGLVAIKEAEGRMTEDGL